MNSHDDILEQLFSQALDKPPGERAAFLDKACADRADVLARVKELLQFHEEPRGPLDHLPCDFFESGPPTNGLEGRVVGRYKLLEKIGEGGMGVVYMAEQQTPVKRKVALKIIKPGMDTKQVIARFEAERQALAMMDHPHIARVLDAGSTKAGHPYFVMELVSGLVITDYCDEARLTVPERLRLFIDVCHAVHHAHQKGIIHRDLKPTNVLVTLHDGVPVVKVIDFGVAKAINQELTERTLFTNFAQIVGTPLYMSPEQAELSGLDIDTRTDIYSLGVLLYELLTGSTPFEKEILKRGGYEEARRIIREEDPPRPSARVSTLSIDVLSTTSAKRGVDPRKLTRQIRRELDWIVMKALEKDRQRRYDSAHQLALDLQRYFGGEPVEACPPSLSYRFRKLVQRNKPAFATLGFVVAFLLLSTIGLILGLWRISQEHAETLKQRNIARKNAATLLERERTLRSYLYAADMQLAFQAYQSGDWESARSKLRAHEPDENQPDQRGFEWHYLWNLCHDESESLQGHRRAVYQLAYSPDGDLLASASADRSITIWDIREKSELAVLRDLKDDINGICFSPDGHFLASAEESRLVRLWDWKTGREVVRLTDFEKPVARVFFGQDSNTLIATEVDWQSNRGQISLWDLATKTRRRVFSGFRALAIHAEKNLLAAASPEGQLSLWSMNTLQQKAVWQGHESHILCATFTPDGQKLISGSRAGNIKSWTLDTLSPTLLPEGHRGTVRDLATTSDGQFLISVGDSGVVRIWDLITAMTQRVLHRAGSRLWSVVVSPSGDSFAVGSEDGGITLRNVSTTTGGRKRIHTSAVPIVDLDLDPADHRLGYVPSGSRELVVIDADTGHIMARRDNSFLKYPSAVSFAANGGALWIGDAFGYVRKWNLQTDELTTARRIFAEKIGRLVVSPDNRYLAANSMGDDRQPRIWDTHVDRTISWFDEDRDEPVHIVSDFPTEDIHLTCQTYHVYLWDLKNGTANPRHFPHKNWVFAAAVSPDKKTLITATEDHSLHFWDILSRSKTAKLSGRWGLPQLLAFSPDGQTLACGTKEGRIEFWHLATRRHLFNLQGHPTPIVFLEFAADGTRLFSAAHLPEGGTEIVSWAIFQEPAVETNHRGAAVKTK